MGPEPRYRRNLGHRDALLAWRDRDTDFVKAPVEGAGFTLASAHRTSGEGWEIPKAGHHGSEQGGMGGRTGVGLASRKAGLPGLS